MSLPKAPTSWVEGYRPVTVSDDLQDGHRRLSIITEEPAPPPPRPRRMRPRFVDCKNCHAAARIAVDESELASLACASCEVVGELRFRWPNVRSRRRREIRSMTISTKRIPQRELMIGRLLFPDDRDAPPRPATRAGCADVPRPCPYVSCRYNLYLDVSPKTGAIKVNFPDVEPGDMPGASCVLDVADNGGRTLEDVGADLNLTRERVRQLEQKAIAHLRPVIGDELREFFHPCGMSLEDES